MRQLLFESGQQAVELLLAMLENPGGEPVQQLVGLKPKKELKKLLDGVLGD